MMRRDHEGLSWEFSQALRSSLQCAASFLPEVPASCLCPTTSSNRYSSDLASGSTNENTILKDYFARGAELRRGQKGGSTFRCIRHIERRAGRFLPFHARTQPFVLFSLLFSSCRTSIFPAYPATVNFPLSQSLSPARCFPATILPVRFPLRSCIGFAQFFIPVFLCLLALIRHSSIPFPLILVILHHHSNRVQTTSCLISLLLLIN
jgi:hypothetical protein